MFVCHMRGTGSASVMQRSTMTMLDDLTMSVKTIFCFTDNGVSFLGTPLLYLSSKGSHGLFN